MIRFTAHLILAFFISSGTLQLNCQTRGINRDSYRISIGKTDEEIEIDGVLDEKTWLAADSTGNFQRVEPTDTGFAIAQTRVRMTYNEKALYLAAICFDPTPGKRPVESLRPDFSFYKNDNFLFFMDTFNDQTNGFSFGLSAAGSLWDGIQANGGTVNLNWDIKWKSAVKNLGDRWIAEFAIPFRSLRYREGEKEWGINFSRLDLKTNEKSSWAPMPRQFATANLAFTGSLVWDKPLPESRTMFSLIPYLSAKATEDKSGSEEVKFTPETGIDAKVILSTSMNIDITLNPDYSQVEVDRQQTNLDRFELFFPEKRQFFLENSDLFASLGTENVRPFFSRRIGLESPVIGGARLSGKIGDNWRIGVMDMQTGENEDIPAANFSVAALQRRVFSRSNVSAFLINKTLTSDTSDTGNEKLPFNRIAGLEYNLASRDNRWTGKAFYHYAVHSQIDNGKSAAALNLTYASQFLGITLNQSFVETDFISESGYIRRTGYYEILPVIQYRFFPVSENLEKHGPGLRIDMLLDRSLDISDRDIQLSYSLVWKDRSNVTFDLKDVFIKLQAPFDPTNTGGKPLEAGEEFDWQEIGISYGSDNRKPFNILLGGRYGGYFNGSRLLLNCEINYRIQPFASIAFVSSFNDINLPDPYSSANLILIGPRLDFTFTNKLFFTSFIQYNNQIDNINLNLRFQWRYAPVSDLFIVFTENAFPGNLQVKNRGLIVKLSYWFN